MPEIMSLVKNQLLAIEKQDFAENCLLQVAVPFAKSNFIRETLTENKHIELNYLGNY
jgi:ribosomal 30S subunit maturation factor RimM